MPNATDYAAYPEHPLNGVPQEVLDVARHVMDDAVLSKDVDAHYAHAIGDAVVASLQDAGYLIHQGEARMQITLRQDGAVAVWLDDAMHSSDLAGLLREIADGFERDPKRIS